MNPFTKHNEAELPRLVDQERVIARALGGLLPEQADQAAFVEPMQRALDVTCGSGAWVIDMALAYPHLQIMGIDSDANMIDYARSQAQVGSLLNASFAVMDARLPLDYPDNFFDLVSARWLSVIGKDAWPQVMSELFRVTRPGGFIRLTETEDLSVTTSPAFEHMTALFLQACQLGGLSLSSRTLGLPPMLPHLLRQAGFQMISKHALVVDWSLRTDYHAPMVFNFKLFFRLLLPSLLAHALTREAIDELEQSYQNIDIELLANDFCAFWTFSTVLGKKSHCSGKDAELLEGQ